MLANWNRFKPRRINFFFSPKTVTTRCNETVPVGGFRHSLLQQGAVDFSHSFATFLPNRVATAGGRKIKLSSGKLDSLAIANAVVRDHAIAVGNFCPS